ncbi:flagellar motor protein MotB [Chitinispirillales bacterium ANBcel5]|uniref:OmpA/MotB family protein n=1 Tax=Cellulosispirillum alkaliphilum TaxID=3039283 RepID=UPI002A54E54B|nr:flagellar motor protein MotB [Chitinispirillales bacterium ANBcel5]
MARKKKEEQAKGAPAYMSTWGDMCTLLLCFFVMLLAMSTIDPAKFHVAASSFQNAFSGVLESHPSILISEEILIPRMGGDEQNKRMAIDATRRIRRTIRREGLEDAIKVEVTESGIAIKIADPIGFDLGCAEIKPELISTLYEIAKTIGVVDGTLIRVEGHTDDLPIRTVRFPSNWELSAARALNVVKFMAERGGIDPARLSAVGYGEFRPLVPNTSQENRSINRRIEIYVDYIQRNDGFQW